MQLQGYDKIYHLFQVFQDNSGLATEKYGEEVDLYLENLFRGRNQSQTFLETLLVFKKVFISGLALLEGLTTLKPNDEKLMKLKVEINTILEDLTNPNKLKEIAQTNLQGHAMRSHPYIENLIGVAKDLQDTFVSLSCKEKDRSSISCVSNP